MVSQPDRPRGPRAAALALPRRGLRPGGGRARCCAPSASATARFSATLREVAPDLGVVVAFGQFLPRAGARAPAPRLPRQRPREPAAAPPGRCADRARDPRRRPRDGHLGDARRARDGRRAGGPRAAPRDRRRGDGRRARGASRRARGRGPRRGARTDRSGRDRLAAAGRERRASFAPKLARERRGPRLRASPPRPSRAACAPSRRGPAPSRSSPASRSASSARARRRRRRRRARQRAARRRGAPHRDGRRLAGSDPAPARGRPAPRTAEFLRGHSIDDGARLASARGAPG